MIDVGKQMGPVRTDLFGTTETNNISCTICTYLIKF
jgi:hypothetical protein